MPLLNRWPECTLTPDSVVFEIGAYRGAWTAEIAHHYNPHLYAFEPAPLAYKHLVEKTSEYTKVATFNFGLGDHGGTFTLYDCERDGATFVPVNRPEYKNAVSKLVDIEQFFRDYGIGHVDLMRINIEGGEHELLPRILDTYINGRIHYLMLHWHWFSDEMNQNCEKLKQRLSESRVAVSDPSNPSWDIWVPL